MPQYVYSTLKPKVNSFKVAEAEDIKFTEDKSVKDAIVDINNTITNLPSGGGEGRQEVYVGTQEPTDTSLIWFDTSDDSDEELTEDDVGTIAELKQVIVEMNQTIQSLQSQITQMQRDIDYLKENGGGGGTTPTTQTIENAFISEDGYVLVDENGYYLITDDVSTGSNVIENALVTEDGYIVIDSDNNYISTV